nr:E3 ubiquitin-protein ligase RING1-like [Ipomoea batatas]
MEEDYSDYDVFYSVRPYPTDSFDCRGASSAASHIHVRFSHRTADDIDDDGGEYEVESRTVCVGDELLEEGSEVDCGNFIYSELPFYWPIHGDVLQEIFDEVIEKAREFKCNLRVDIRTVHLRDYEEDRDFGAAAEGVNNGAAPVASDGMSVVKSLKRKRIEEGGGNCCVICLEELKAGRDVAVLPCTHHSFHDDCLSSWFQRSRSCPLCRRKISDSSS